MLLGPYPIERATGAGKRIGVFVLCSDGTSPRYVGRSDRDIGHEIRRVGHVFPEIRDFLFEITDSAEDAFKLECRLWHEIRPPLRRTHPVAPAPSESRCPLNGCAGH